MHAQIHRFKALNESRTFIGGSRGKTPFDSLGLGPRNRSRRRRKVLFFRGPNFFLLVGFCQVQRLNKAVVSLVRTRLSVGQSRNFFDSLSTQSSDRSRNKSNRNKLVSCRKSVDQLERENLEAFSRDSLDRQQRAGCSWRLEVRDKDRRVSWCTFGLYMQLLSDLRMTTAMEVKNTSNFNLCLTMYCVA